MTIPANYVHVEGRSRDKAIKLITASDTVLKDEGHSIRAVRNGYHVPAEVFDEYESIKGEELPRNEISGGPFSLKPPVTNTTPWVESTTIEDEGRTLERGSTPLTEAAIHSPSQTDMSKSTGVGPEVEPASDPVATEEPPGNASKGTWLSYAEQQDSWDEADAELGRDELREKYGSK